MSKTGNTIPSNFTSTNFKPINSYGKENVLNQQYSNINNINNININNNVYSPNNINRNFNYNKSASMFTFKSF
jgi:hypothetical protein